MNKLKVYEGLLPFTRLSCNTNTLFSKYIGLEAAINARYPTQSMRSFSYDSVAAGFAAKCDKKAKLTFAVPNVFARPL